MNGTRPRSKPWFARARVNNEHFSLGYFESREEAIATEDAFREYMRDLQLHLDPASVRA